MERRLPKTVPQEFVPGSMLINGVSAWCPFFALHPRKEVFGLVVFHGHWFLFFPFFICASTSTTLSLGMYLASMLHLLSTFVILSFVSNLTTHTYILEVLILFATLLPLLRTPLTSFCLAHFFHSFFAEPQHVCSYHRPTVESCPCNVSDLSKGAIFINRRITSGLCITLLVNIIKISASLAAFGSPRSVLPVE